jgi:trimeric autotransporter adhesin
MGRLASTSGRHGAFVYGDASVNDSVKATRDNQFVARAQHIWLGSNNSVSNPARHFLTTSTGAHLTTGGAWTNSSDASRKEDFEEADAEQVLERRAQLPVMSWRYREEAGARHLGPTVQDFHATFGLGGSQTSIATVDADGVAMLAIQALERRTRELRDRTGELERMRQEVTALRAELARLEVLVQRLADAGFQVEAPAAR